MLATLPISDEILVFPSTVLRNPAEDAPYAFAFGIPSATPGLKFICRESLDYDRNSFDSRLPAGLRVHYFEPRLGPATATLTVGEGTITVAVGDSGVSISGGNGTGTVTLSGTIAQLDNLLTGGGTGTIVYLNSSDTPSASTTFTVTVNDLKTLLGALKEACKEERDPSHTFIQMELKRFFIRKKWIGTF